MKFSVVYFILGISKAFAILALILIIAGLCVKSYAYTFEMDYSGPGSEYEASMERYRDQDNRNSWERSQNDYERGRESSRNDREKADQYEKDHGA